MRLFLTGEKAFAMNQSVMYNLFGHIVLSIGSGKMKYLLKNRYDDEKLCNNPDKGWYVHYYDNGISRYGTDLSPEDTLDDFPLMDHAYLRLAWSYLEPEEGKYDWNIIDKIIDPWVAAGKRVSFRITCKETKSKETEKQCYATPKWVFDAGAEGSLVKECMEPEYGDPIFLQKLENFHRAFAERYDGRDEVIYVDIGSYGDWGEGHCCVSSGKDWPIDVIKKHIDIYLICYKHTQLVISDDVIGSRISSEGCDDLLNYIIDNGITFRDDSVCVDYFSERYGYDTLRSHPLFDRAWRKFPTILENAHYSHVKEFGTDPGGWPFLASVEGSHATYGGFHGYPREWLNDHPEMAVMTANRLGYWYFLYAVDMPESSGSEFPVTCYFENKGAAPSYKDYKLDFILRGDGAEYVCEAKDFCSREMMPHTVTVREHKLKFDAPAGKYGLYLRMHNDADRTVELGMKDEYRAPDGSYFINDIIIK